jgi:hypothetical protein
VKAKTSAAARISKAPAISRRLFIAFSSVLVARRRLVADLDLRS